MPMGTFESIACLTYNNETSKNYSVFVSVQYALNEVLINRNSTIQKLRDMMRLLRIR